MIQPLKKTATYGLRPFQYYGAHVWNMLPINIKAAHSLHEFKSLIRSWPGPTCSRHICIALLWLIMLLLCIAHCGGGLSMWRLCGRLWHRVVTTTCGAVGSSYWRSPPPPPPPPPPMYILKRIYIYIYMYIYAEFLTIIHVLISYLIGSEAKWPAFRSRRHFRMYIAKWKLNVLKSVRSFSTGLDTGLALFRRQAIV